MKSKIEKIRKKLQERKYITDKAIEDIKEICNAIEMIDGIDTIHECVVPLFFDSWGDKFYFGVKKGILDVWYPDMSRSKMYIWEYIRNKEITLEEFVNVLEEFFKKLEEIQIPKESAEKISKILEILRG